MNHSLTQAIEFARTGQLDQARRLCDAQLSSEPANAEAWHLSGLLYTLSGEPRKAIERIERAIKIHSGSAKFHSNLANALLATGEPVAAERHYRQALQYEPLHSATLHNLGLLLARQFRYAEAVALLELNPTLEASEHKLLGDWRQHAGNMAGALQSYLAAHNAGSDDAALWAELAHVQESLNQIDAATLSVARALDRDPAHAFAQLVKGRLLRRANHFIQARDTLDAIDTAQLHPSAAAALVNERGHILDRLGHSEPALACFVEAKRIQYRQASQDASVQTQRYLEDLQFLLELDLRTRAEATQASDEPQPVFLIGFPRSGTTLLGQILDCHPSLQTLEEKPLVQTVVASCPEYFSHDASPLTPAARRAVQVLYFTLSERECPSRPGVTSIDKLPLNLTRAHHILRIFPRARFILALRHPCDVCLSCLMQLFASNSAMAQFQSPESTIRFYVLVMRLWEKFTRELPLNLCTVRYESLVQDFDAEIGKVLNFLDLPWDEALRQHAQHAQERGHIDTPSYQQVSEALYQHAQGRWLRYRNAFEPWLPLLEPALKAHGYTP